MSSRFLPIHPRLTNRMLNGATILHCGEGKNYRGLVGMITSYDSERLYIRWKGRATSLSYSREWSMNNLRVSVVSLKSISSTFHGEGYAKKYASFVVTSGRSFYPPMNHADMKAMQVSEQEPVVDTPVIDPKDEVGHYMTVKVIGGKIASHKTLRLAELAATAHTEKYQEEVIIYKEVARTKPVVTCKAEVTYA